MGQDQNYQDKSWLLPALEERLVEFQAAAPRWLLALQGNLPGAVRLSQQSGYPGAVTELVQANKSRKLSNGTWFGGVHHSSPRLATIAVFLLKKNKTPQNKTAWISPFRMLLALAGGQPAGWESWSPIRHLGAAAHMVAHRGCWAHSVQRGWGSWVIPPWDAKEKEPRTAVWNHPEGVTEKTEPKKLKRLCGLTVGGVWSSARWPSRQQIGLSNLPSGSPWPTLLSDLLFQRT